MELGYNRKKAGDFYEAGYKLEDCNTKSDELKRTEQRKRNFIVFNF